LTTLLDTYNNLYVDISWELSDYIIENNLIDNLINYKNRLFISTDISELDTPKNIEKRKSQFLYLNNFFDSNNVIYNIFNKK
jgi:hypothetical protein